MSNNTNMKLRFNIITTITYIIGIILIIQLFNLQIVKGEQYTKQSNTRLTREARLEAARGEFLSRTGDPLIVSNTQVDLEIYKTKISEDELNEAILNIVKVLEKYNVNYIDKFPINIETKEFKITGNELNEFLSRYKLNQNSSVDDVMTYFKEMYSIKKEDINEIRKIIAIRYAITIEQYSSTKSIKIAENIPSEAVAIFSEQGDKFPGINLPTKSQREYPQGTLASHILGYVGNITEEEYDKNKEKYESTDMIGKTGVEYAFEDFVKGKDGIKQIDMDIEGAITNEYIQEEAIAGADVILTIDANLQKITEDALAKNIQKIANGDFGTAYKTNSGAAVVMKVDTGEILAMASYPNYDPSQFIGGISIRNWNSYVNDKSKPLMNKATQLSYSPGSIFKMITGIAALETGNVTVGEKFYDTGIYTKYPATPMKCWYYSDYHVGHGWVNVTQAIEKSCNYYFYEASDRMGIDNLVKYAQYFGLGYKTGVELPDETSGVLASKETKAKLHPEDSNWNPGNTLNSAIGQGDNEFSPLQMTRYISMLANGGKDIDVTLVNSIIKPDGRKYSKEEIDAAINTKLGLTQINKEKLNIKPENVQPVLDGMKSVTGDSGGTAYGRFKDFDIAVGGKTGSAEAPNNKVHGWFAGFAPFDNPEIAVVVMVDNGGHGNYTAEAVVDIMEEYFGMNVKNVEEDITALPYTESFN